MDPHQELDGALAERAGANVMLFDELDRRSIALRYPPGVLDPLAGIDIDLRRLKRVMRAIHLWLSGVWGARDAEAQNEADMRWYKGADAYG